MAPLVEAARHGLTRHGAWLHGVGEFESPRIHLTVPRGFRMSDDALILHVADLPAEDIEARPGFRLTTLTRSLIDVAAEPAVSHRAPQPRS